MQLESDSVQLLLDGLQNPDGLGDNLRPDAVSRQDGDSKYFLLTHGPSWGKVFAPYRPDCGLRAGQGSPDHSPLEGESQKPSRQAKADAVGGGRHTTKLRRSATPGRFSTFLIY